MRPQHITAENKPAEGSMSQAVYRFNEAAAYHCGKHSGVYTGYTNAGKLQ